MVSSLGQAGLGAVGVGTVLGIIVAFLLPISLTSQGIVSLAASAFFISSNFVPHQADSYTAVAGGCGTVGLFCGYGAAASVQALLLLSSREALATMAYLPVPMFLLLVMLFHIMEFAFVAFFHANDLGFRSLMLSPVPMGAYSIAMVSGLAEYWLELQLPSLFWPLFWIRTLLLVVGIVAGLGGWALRAIALFTAESNFTHLVAYRKEASHVLVTHGVYSCCRHPGYLGWFLWSVSTQLVLGNPVCTLGYAAVAYKFFHDRIPDEEAFLVDFFGEEYLAYASRVPCGLPGISNLHA